MVYGCTKLRAYKVVSHTSSHWLWVKKREWGRERGLAPVARMVKYRDIWRVFWACGKAPTPSILPRAASPSLCDSVHRQLIWSIYRMEPYIGWSLDSWICRIKSPWVCHTDRAPLPQKNYFAWKLDIYSGLRDRTSAFLSSIFGLETSHGWALVINCFLFTLGNLPGWPLGSFSGALRDGSNTGTSSCLKLDDTAFSDCLTPISPFTVASFFFHCRYTQCFSQPFLPLVFPYVMFVPFLYGVITC